VFISFLIPFTILSNTSSTPSSFCDLNLLDMIRHYCLPDVVYSIYPPSHTPLGTLSLYSTTLLRVQALISYHIMPDVVSSIYLPLHTHITICAVRIQYYPILIYITTHTSVFSIIQYVYILNTHINDETPHNVSYCVQYLFNQSLCYYIHCMLHMNIYTSTFPIVCSTYLINRYVTIFIVCCT
jgi:hypothetical protein